MFHFFGSEPKHHSIVMLGPLLRKFLLDPAFGPAVVVYYSSKFVTSRVTELCVVVNIKFWQSRPPCVVSSPTITSTGANSPYQDTPADFPGSPITRERPRNCQTRASISDSGTCRRSRVFLFFLPHIIHLATKFSLVVDKVLIIWIKPIITT